MSLVFVDRYQSILVLPTHRSWLVAQRKSWLCQYLGVLIPQLMQLAGRQDEARSDQQGDKPPPPFICPYNWHVIDTHGDHMHTCKKHIGSAKVPQKDTHETILDALEKICHASGLSIQSHNIPLGVQGHRQDRSRRSCHQGRQPPWNSAHDH